MQAGTTTTPHPQALLRGRHDVQDWWVPAFRGLILCFGGFAFLLPGHSLTSAGLLFAAVAMMGGGALLHNARELQSHNARELQSIVPTAQGLIACSLGALSIVFVDGPAVAMLVCMSLWVVTTGAFDLFLAWRHRLLRGRRLLFCAGGVALAGGIALLIAAVTAASWWQRLLGGTLAIQGLLLLGAGLRRSRSAVHVLKANVVREQSIPPQRLQSRADADDSQGA